MAGLRDFRDSMSETFSFENIVLVVSVGFILLQLVSYVGSTWFGWAPQFFGPYLLLAIIGAIVISVFTFLRREHEFMTFSRADWVLIVIAMGILVGALIIFRKNDMFSGFLFNNATDKLMSIIGVK
jgi:hypothetical protein